MESLLEDVIEMFRFISNRDMFIRVYGQLMGQRMLYKTTYNDDKENSMILRLQLEVGQCQIMQTEKMFKDVINSRDNQLDWPSAGGIPMTVSVLTMSLWEMDDTQLTHWPTHMTRQMALFQ